MNLNLNEDFWRDGATAVLVAPYPVERGMWQVPVLVQAFVKSGNRWISVPDATVTYPTVAALALDAELAEILQGPEIVITIEPPVAVAPSQLPSAPADLLAGAMEDLWPEIPVEQPVTYFEWDDFGGTVPIDDPYGVDVPLDIQADLAGMAPAVTPRTGLLIGAAILAALLLLRK